MSQRSQRMSSASVSEMPRSCCSRFGVLSRIVIERFGVARPGKGKARAAAPRVTWK